MTETSGRAMAAGHDDHLALGGAWNFRDVASTVASEGMELARGRLFRSSTLSALSPDGGARLNTLGIEVAVDLRSAYELRVHGQDVVPTNVEVLHRPFEPGLTSDAPHVLPPMGNDEHRMAHMVKSYRVFPRLKGAGPAICTVVDLLVHEPCRPVVVHCAAGKDRTGWVVAAVLLASGVPLQAVTTDYLASNDAVGVLRRYLNRVDPQADLSDLLLGVRAEYLNAALLAVDEVYGGLSGYLDSIGVDPNRRRALREVMLRSGTPE